MHEGDAALRARVLAATAKDSETRLALRTDAAVRRLFALANALHQATTVVDDLRIVTPTGAGMTRRKETEQ